MICAECSAELSELKEADQWRTGLRWGHTTVAVDKNGRTIGCDRPRPFIPELSLPTTTDSAADAPTQQDHPSG